jgi:uncharacterized protein (TIGR02646 family)
MIRVARGLEPVDLATLRTAKLIAIRALGRDPTSNEIDGYRIVAESLWRSQHHKCCYCEAKIPQRYNDVEHYRPKAAADRMPGCVKTHGYWWLAFSWENLLFACPSCNRSNKNSRFPLSLGCESLMPEDSPPGNESPLLIDPSAFINPVEHIEFVYERVVRAGRPRHWWARPRNGSLLGNETIKVCGLNDDDLVELREDHYSTIVLPHCQAIELAISAKDSNALKKEFDRALGLLKPRCTYVGLTYDAFRHSIPNAKLTAILGVRWPEANLIPL